MSSFRKMTPLQPDQIPINELSESTPQMLKRSVRDSLYPIQDVQAMKTCFFLLFVAVMLTPAIAQKSVHYTVWADGLINPQIPKSSLYFLGTGVRGEVSRPIRNSANVLFAQVGYGHFFQKITSAFVANIGLLNVGYRYQSRKAFNASVGVGTQYWSERMRLRFPDYTINETLNSLIPSVTVGIGFRIKSRYSIGLENRVLVKPETGTFILRNNAALSIGYTL